MKRGDKVILIQSGFTHQLRGKTEKRIPIGTSGVVIKRRLKNQSLQFLVKFKGVGTPRHCETTQIKPIGG